MAAGVALKLDLEGLPGLEKRLNALAAFGETGRKTLLDDVGEEIITQTLQHFQEEKGPDGTPWKKSRRAEAQGGLTLTDAAQLRGSINKNLGADFVEVGTNKIYGPIHQLGGDAGRGRKVHLPARPYLPEDLDQVQSLDALVDDLIDRMVGGL